MQRQSHDEDWHIKERGKASGLLKTAARVYCVANKAKQRESELDRLDAQKWKCTHSLQLEPHS